MDTTTEEIGRKAWNDAYNQDLGQEIANTAEHYAQWGAKEQKEIDDAELGKALLYCTNKTTERVTKELVAKACSDHTIEQLGILFLDPTMSCKQKADMAKEIIKRALEE